MSQPRNQYKCDRRNERHAKHNAQRRALRKQRASGRKTTHRAKHPTMRTVSLLSNIALAQWLFADERRRSRQKIG